MITISLCMIVKNESKVLGRCLDSIAGAVDEIIIVDTGSGDDTKNIAAAYTDKVYDFPWQDNFSAARNFSFSKGTMDYCMWLDADDVVPPDSSKKLLRLKKTLAPDTDMVMMPYAAAFHSDGSPSFIYYRERLVRNHAGFQWAGHVHECIAPSGKVVYEDMVIEHRKPAGSVSAGRNLAIYERMLSDGLELNTRDRFYYARELFYNQRPEAARENFIKVIYDDNAWSENRIDACRLLAMCDDRLGLDDEALEALFKSFAFDIPRAEILYDIGMHFQKKKDYHRAVYWYELALGCRENASSGGFVEKDYYGYYPSVQLCVCHYALGDVATAYAYHKKSGQWHTDTPEYTQNEAFFKKYYKDKQSR